MKIKETLLKIVAGIGFVFSAVFYVLFQLKKDQDKNQKEEYQEEKINNLSEENETINKINKKYTKEKKTHEEMFNEAVHDIGNPDVVPGSELLQQLRKEGKERNS